MYKKIGSLILVFLMGCASPLTIQAKAQKPTLTVLLPNFSSEVPGSLRKRFNLQSLQSEIERAIQATGKFEIITRQAEILSDIMAEQAFSASELSRGQAAAQGMIDAVNFIVRPEVANFAFYRSSKAVPNIDNKYKQSDHGALQLTLRIVDTTSGAIKKTFVIKDSFSTKKKISNRKGGTPPNSMLLRMFANIANQFANQLVDTVFPMVVLQVKAGNIFISRGADGGLEVGDKLTVYSAGEEMFDPYTKESLGMSEVELGKIHVVDIRPKFTVAKPVDASLLDLVSQGNIVRE